MTHYLCSQTGVSYPLTDIRWRSDVGALLDLPLASNFDPTKLNPLDTSLWRYQQVLPSLAVQERVSWGEGMTPLQSVSFGGRKVEMKFDQLFPSGSYKDRGATVLLSLAKALGVERVVQDSSGNAGCAVAQYGTMADIACDIYVPADTAPAKLVQLAAYGATVHRVPGSREDTATAARKAAETTFYASHVWHPVFFQGTKTFAYEVCEQRGWRAPDTVILPAGNGTLLLGAWIGFRELRQMGIIEREPRLVGVQAAHCAPLYEAFQSGETEVSEVSTQPTLAEGIAIALPLRGHQMLQAVRETSGRFMIVAEAEIKASLQQMVRQGIFLEPTSAAVVAGVQQYLDQFAEQDEEIVSVITGHGLKAGDKIQKMLG